MHEEIIATFSPKRTEDLSPRAQMLVGWRGRWSHAWTITEEDGGDYVGQDAWLPILNHWIGWVPTEDLTDMVTTWKWSGVKVVRR